MPIDSYNPFMGRQYPGEVIVWGVVRTRCIAQLSRLNHLYWPYSPPQQTSQRNRILVQTFPRIPSLPVGLYASELFLRDGSFFLFTIALAFFIHAMAPNKYIGYFTYVVFLIANAFIWRPLNVSTFLVRFGMRPEVVYSDFFGDAPFRAGWTWFTIDWLLFCALLSIAAVLFWPRGKQSWAQRPHEAGLRFRGGLRPAALVCLLLWAGTGAWIGYNTMVLNPLYGPKDLQRLQADYEKTYQPLNKLPQPRVGAVEYAIDIYPETRI